MSTLYHQLTAQTFMGLDEARSRCSEMLKNSPTPDDKHIIHIHKARINADWQKVYQESLAVGQGRLVITAPTQPDFDRAKQIAYTLDKMTAKANTIGEVIQLTTELMVIWGRTDPQHKV